jgi:hypothetical protein
VGAPLAADCVWAAIIPIQTISVHNEGKLDALYPVVNTLILAAGIGFNVLGARLRRRREKQARNRASVETPA